MRSVGIRELRQRASEVLRLVERGESFEVTDRGRPIARLVPLEESSPLDALRAAGDVTGSAGSIDDLPHPISLAPGQPSASEVLAALRANER